MYNYKFITPDLSTRTTQFISRWCWRIIAFNFTKTIRKLSNSRPVNLHNVKDKTHRIGISQRSSSPTRPISLSNLTAPTSGLEITGELLEYTVEDQPGEKVVSDQKNPLRTFIRHFSGLILMVFSSCQILNSYVCEPDTLAPSYLSFLITHGGMH